MLKRRYVTVGGTRQVHYRCGGSGPLLVMIHESPLSSAALVALASSLVDRFTVIALDTPGYGNSDPLPSPAQPEVADYAEATAETLAALNVEHCVLYGALTGGAIALELARSRPDVVGALTLDFLPWFPAEQRAFFLENYLPLFPTRADGGHLTTLWARFRDQYAHLPWFDRDLVARMDIDMPNSQLIHDGVMDMLRAGDGYRVAYSAAFRYEPEAPLAEVNVPVALIAPIEEFLTAQTDLLKEPPVATATAPLPGGREAETIIRQLGDVVASDVDDGPSDSAVWTRVGKRITSSYVDTSVGQLHVRGRPGDDARPVVLLHPSPGSALMLHGLIEHLMESRPVIAFDTLGNGESDKPPGWEVSRSWEPQGHRVPTGQQPPEVPWDAPQIVDYASVVAEAVDALDFDEFDLYGSHTGGAIAIETAIVLGPDRVRNLVVDGLAMFTSHEQAEHLAHYTPPLEPRWDGSHLAWAWSYLEAQTRFWPWYTQTREGIRWVDAVSPDDLHTWVVELLKSGHTYPLAYRAAFTYAIAERLPLLRSRAMIGASSDDPLAELSEEGARIAPGAIAVVMPGRAREKAALCARFLDGSDDPAR
jgi:pimeloyl-ACP methyl ester carboxylesterase